MRRGSSPCNQSHRICGAAAVYGVVVRWPANGVLYVVAKRMWDADGGLGRRKSVSLALVLTASLPCCLQEHTPVTVRVPDGISQVRTSLSVYCLARCSPECVHSADAEYSVNRVSGKGRRSDAEEEGRGRNHGIPRFLASPLSCQCRVMPLTTSADAPPRSGAFRKHVFQPCLGGATQERDLQQRPTAPSRHA